MSMNSVSYREYTVGFEGTDGVKLSAETGLDTGIGGGKWHRNEAETQQVETVSTDDASVAVTLSAEAIAELKFMIEEEKLAGDLYEAFYDVYGEEIFANIEVSEDHHFDALVDYAEKIGVDVDSFVFDTAGEFSNPELQEMYDTLLEQGLTSLEDALEVGVAIEEKDIVDIAAAAEAVPDTALADIYENLLQGSYAHLDAFEALL
ncbi:DUF2202 domain-containing protein [Phaeobacter gallaeciensis]|uniref:DUF2202 domain-containing protein n=1 Tax=Phaeobacter gallaeciensis TaxID=60890 RepID=UPI00237F0A3D|nr:DUF2202 domain-containing protein [Phaeobacter gallaeciensis]MDE4190912.1 DUF2202 domain-containing protein [Phaeobacter gallaeciensis]MDE4199378.1 DUF2202 domain-containing protein [Phaeobacter gallaeciensis]MDE4203526.1 DUF2202 domain-containing protein [Phaeobacter gallaeciensis]MDE4207668.1 DUF2202 domain-containing protein [Phaeobacter gallaeciensis]MDE4216035.1 DUF2202 domain-containing protein [Phaeobacter gallaeciensis]